VNQVSRVSPQYFFSSLSADCCSVPVQLIGFDPQTDFAIQPWVAQKIGGNLADGELVVGSDIEAGAGGFTKFFDQDYKVLAKLDKTSTGFDQSVFMNMDTAHGMLNNLKNIGCSTLTEGDNDISAVMVDVEEGSDINVVAQEIQTENKDVDVIVSKSMFSEISESLNTLVSYINIISASFWILVVFILFIPLFIIIINSIINIGKRA
jgi:putative ABC transport system permease protein